MYLTPLPLDWGGWLAIVLIGLLALLLGAALGVWLRGRSVVALEQENERLHLDLAERQADLAALQTRVAVAEERISRLPALTEALESREQELDDFREECAALRARLESERRGAEEKLAVLQNAEAQLFVRFESLAQRILDEKTQKFTEQNRVQLDGVLTPFRQQLGDFRKKVDDIQLHDAKDRASLRQEIENLRQQTARINQEAINLTRALKGDKKMQGTWGELLLERILEQSGLRKGHEYETQGSFRDEEQRLLRPDVIVRLPEGKDVVIDSKVSLLAYERYCTLEDGPERDAALREHVQAVRNHVKGLSRKDYSGLKGLRSLDFILLFMPIEAAFVLAFHADEQLFNDAFEQHIVIVTPTTLLATLRTIENIWRYERRNENAKAIADKASSVYEKLRGFVDDMEKVGTQLGGASRAYEDAMNKLARGKGNLIRQAESFVELGAKVSKRLPKSILERAELDESGLTDDLEALPGKAESAVEDQSL